MGLGEIQCRTAKENQKKKMKNIWDAVFLDSQKKFCVIVHESLKTSFRPFFRLIVQIHCVLTSKWWRILWVLIRVLICAECGCCTFLCLFMKSDTDFFWPLDLSIVLVFVWDQMKWIEMSFYLPFIKKGFDLIRFHQMNKRMFRENATKFQIVPNN